MKYWASSHSDTLLEIIRTPWFSSILVAIGMFAVIIWALVASTRTIANLPETVKALRAYWKLYFELVGKVLLEVEKRGLSNLREAWQTEQENDLQRYIAEVDKLSSILPLPLKFKKPRLCLHEPIEGTIKPAQQTVIITYEIDSIAIILTQYKYFSGSGKINTLKNNVEDSYNKFMKELDALEPVVQATSS